MHARFRWCVLYSSVSTGIFRVMTNYVTLDNVVHAEIKVDGRFSSEYGNCVNQTRVFVTEFEDIQREYAIFFRKNANGEFYAVTLLGLDLDENLYLEGTIWNARYVPAVMQRGPFQIGVPEKGDPIIKIDLDDLRLGSGNGALLFKPNGGLSSYLTHVSKILNKIHVGLEMNSQFFKEVTDASLMESVTLDLKLDDTTSYTVPGLYSINDTAFQALSGSDLERFHGSGLLTLCQYVLSSRKNIQHLLDLKTLKMNASN